MKYSTSRAGSAATLNPELVLTEAYVGGPWGILSDPNDSKAKGMGEEAPLEMSGK